LAQLDEWLTKCEELRVLDRDQVTRALVEEISASPVAPNYLKREARRRDRAILQVTDAIFLAQGAVMLRLNILEGSVLWKDPVETIGGNGKVKFRDEASPEDFRITPRAPASRRELRPRFQDSERLSAQSHGCSGCDHPMLPMGLSGGPLQLLQWGGDHTR